MSVKGKDEKWAKPTLFAYNRPASYSVGHAALNSRGDVLYFTSDMPGGMGKTDIWYCEKDADGNWSTPQNCGPQVNTPEDEMFPTIGVNGDLFFSSTGHPGMGGLDIFTVVGEKGRWEGVRNLRPPFNSESDDFYFVLAANGSGFLSSNRMNGKGSDDIYSFSAYQPFRPEVPPVVLPVIPGVLRTIVFNARDSALVENSVVTLEIPLSEVSEEKRSNGRGQADFSVKADKGYLITIQKDKFTTLTTRMEASVQEGDTLVQYFYLQPEPPIEPPAPYKMGEIFVLENLHYDYNKHIIRKDAAKILDSLVSILKRYPKMEIELSSHTDSRGSDVYNMILSEKRALAAAKYLTDKGIAPSRVKAKGYGETRLLNKCVNGVPCGEEDHQINRRTAVQVLTVGQ